jgi:hypothetical protein
MHSTPNKHANTMMEVVASLAETWEIWRWMHGARIGGIWNTQTSSLSSSPSGFWWKRMFEVLTAEGKPEYIGFRRPVGISSRCSRGRFSSVMTAYWSACMTTT